MAPAAGQCLMTEGDSGVESSVPRVELRVAMNRFLHRSFSPQRVGADRNLQRTMHPPRVRLLAECWRWRRPTQVNDTISTLKKHRFIGVRENI